jgi:anti-sigma regulatory factor (Ser/Thr protein kinase)
MPTEPPERAVPTGQPTHVARFTMTSEAQQLARTRSWLWTQLVGQALPLEECSSVLVAVGEICNNVIKHAYSGEPGRPIAITLSVFPDRFVVDVEDEGAPYDPRNYAPPDLDAVPERGVGLFLVQHSVDEVAFDVARARGRRWTLVKYRARPAASPTA